MAVMFSPKPRVSVTVFPLVRGAGSHDETDNAINMMNGLFQIARGWH